MDIGPDMGASITGMNRMIVAATGTTIVEITVDGGNRLIRTVSDRLKPGLRTESE